MKAKVQRAIDEFHLLQQGDCVVAAVSGGADSIALLHFLAQYQRELMLKVIACHVNHHLRGEESDRDQSFVEKMCLEWKIPCEVFHVDVRKEAQKRKQGLEECARDLRYDIFFQMASKYGAKVATAHTLSDSLETVLFHLARGTSLCGLCGIPPIRGFVIRPLIRCSREEVEDYCAEHDLPFVTDSSNLSNDYTRNKIRHEVIPVLKEINPSLFSTAADTLDFLRRDETYLSAQADKALAAACCGERYLVSAISDLDDSVLSRVLSLLWKKNGMTIDRVKLSLAMQLVRSGNGKLQIAQEKYFRVGGGFLEIVPEFHPADYFEIKIVPGMLTLPSGTVYNIDYVSHLETNVNKKLLYMALDYDKIKGNLIVRQRKSGDRIRLPQRGVTKTLKKLWNEVALPVEDRSKLGVFCDDFGVVAVEGFGVDERVACGPNTREMLMITLVSNKAQRKESNNDK